MQQQGISSLASLTTSLPASGYCPADLTARHLARIGRQAGDLNPIDIRSCGASSPGSESTCRSPRVRRSHDRSQRPPGAPSPPSSTTSSPPDSRRRSLAARTWSRSQALVQGREVLAQGGVVDVGGDHGAGLPKSTAHRARKRLATGPVAAWKMTPAPVGCGSFIPGAPYFLLVGGMSQTPSPSGGREQGAGCSCPCDRG